MGRKFDLTFFEQHGAEWVETIRAAHRERLDREPTSAEITFYLSRIMSNAWDAPAIQRNIEALDEFKNRQQPPEPPAPPIPPIPPTPPTPPPVIEKVEAVGSRAVSAGLQVGLTRFYWLREWKFNRDRVLRELDQDAAAGFTYARVLAQVGSHDPQDPWYGLMTDPNWPDHSELVRGLTEAAMARGMRILWTFLGKAMPKQADRRVFVARMADVLKSVPAGVLTQEIMNEPACGSGLTGGYITASEILELRDIAAANGLLSATGAVWTEPDWVKETPYPDATGMTPEGWAKTQRGVGISHNDRDMSRGEGQDRPWRQGWDIGLEGMRWIENEGVGPGIERIEREPA